MASLIDALTLRVRVLTSGGASQELSEVKELLLKGAQAARHAHDKLPPGGDAVALARGASALEEVYGKLETAYDRALDVQAILRIRDAMRVLNNPSNIHPGSQVAAKAFGELFVGAGHFVGKLPPPVNAYALVLDGCGDFFVNMQTLLDPERRPNGRQLREVMASMD